MHQMSLGLSNYITLITTLWGTYEWSPFFKWRNWGIEKLHVLTHLIHILIHAHAHTTINSTTTTNTTIQWELLLSYFSWWENCGTGESGELHDLPNTVQLVSDKGRIRMHPHPRVRHMSSQPFSSVLVTFSSICIEYLLGLPLCFKPIFK